MTRFGFAMLGITGWLGLTLGVACSATSLPNTGTNNKTGGTQDNGGSGGTDTGGGSGGTNAKAGDNSGGGNSAGANAGGGSNTDKKDLGGFTVTLVAETNMDGTVPAHTAILGKVFADVYPSPVSWEVVQEDGGCQVLNKTAHTCVPECASGACVAENECVEYPKVQSVGAVKVKGFGNDFSLTEIKGSYQLGASASVSYPPCPEGEEFSVEAAGKDPFEAFSIATKGIAPLKLTTTTFDLKDGEAFKLEWDPPKSGGASRVQVHLDISHHGGGTAKIECDVPDNGAMSVPATLVTKLISYGTAGFPSVVVTRSSVGTVDVKAGTVSLKMASGIEQMITVPGVTSCNDDNDCPSKKCGSDLKCTD